MKAFITLALVLATILAKAQPTFLKGEDPKSPDKNWVPVPYLTDEFNGHTPDTTKWQINPVGHGWKWYGRAPGLFRPENIHVSHGEMKVTVGKLESPIVRDGKTFTHQGAIVRALKPGTVGMYFECRMKANATVMSSTFWLMSRYKCDKKLETDIQECVGQVSPLAEKWAQGWDSIYHSNAIHRETPCNEKLQLQKSVQLDKPNHDEYHIYAAWWKSPEEILFFLDGKYQYSIYPKVAWDQPAFIHMAVETYSWNPIPPDGGLVEHGTRKQRTTRYDWVRVWKLE